MDEYLDFFQTFPFVGCQSSAGEVWSLITKGFGYSN
jgi:hypothetical protein